jgi:HK97 family phage portal protein
LYDALMRKWNAGEDAFAGKRQAMLDLIDSGWSYHDITVGSTWSFDRIDPMTVTPERITSGPSKGRWLFHIRDEKTGLSKTRTQDDVFYLRASEGKGILERARESLGIAKVTETYASTIYSKGQLRGGLIKVPGKMDPESARAMAQSFVTAIGEWHMPSVLPQGADWVERSGLTPESAQMLLSRKFSIDEMARWLGVPRQMLENADPSHGNAEQFDQTFVTYSLGHWFSLIEGAGNDQLVLQPARFYMEFKRDALVRGDIAARWNAYQIAISTGTFTRNEVRQKENMKKLPGLDKPIDPAFLAGKQGQQPSQQQQAAPKPAPARAPSEPPSKAMAIAQASAARLLRKEITAVQKLAVRHAADGDAFAEAVTEFYAGHVSLVIDTLQMAASEAHGYCAGQAAQIVNGEWVAAVEQWATEQYAAGLAALALEEAA